MWRQILPCFILLLVFGNPAFCWTSKTYQLIVVKSMRLMPKSFQNVMLRHQEEILKACLLPDSGPESSHTYDVNTRSGLLQDRIMALTQDIPRKMNAHAPFREVAQDFGSLSHYIADLNDPTIVGMEDPREDQYRQDFAVYLEKNIELFPWIFDGHEDAILQSGQIPEYIYRVASNTVEKYPRLGEAFFPEGVLVSSDTFDPKSLPFGIASLSWSRSIQQTVQLWFYAWRKANGDVTLTPFFSKKKPPRSRP